LPRRSILQHLPGLPANQLPRPAKYELTGYGLFVSSDSAALATLCIARVLYSRMLFLIILVDV
jgi:hypothetical protein